MLELLNIFYFFSIFILIFSFPFNKFTTNKLFKIYNSKLNFFDFQSINIIFFLYIILIISFFDLPLKLIFYIYISFSLIFIFTNLLRKNDLKKINNKIDYFLFSIITISLFVYVAHNLKLEWDGHHWLEKVVFFYHENKISDFYKLKVHPEYPHLGSFIWALFWKNSLVNYEYVGRLFCIYFYVISIFSITNYVENINKNLKIYISLFLILITFEPYLFAGYQDYFLFSILILCSRLIFILNFEKVNNNLFVLIILSLGLLMWFKDEGLFYFLIFGVLLILNVKLTINLKICYLALIFSLLTFNFMTQKFLLGIYELPSGTASESLMVLNKLMFDFGLIFEKSFKILIHLIISSIKYLAIVLVIISLFTISLKKKFDIKIKYLVQCFLVNLIFLYTSFMTFGAIDYMLTVALDRLLFQTSGFYLIVSLFLINILINKNYK